MQCERPCKYYETSSFSSFFTRKLKIACGKKHCKSKNDTTLVTKQAVSNQIMDICQNCYFEGSTLKMCLNKIGASQRGL